MSEINKLTYAVSLGIVLAVLWLLLSGHYTALLVAFGIFSVAFAVFVALRMEVVDHESHPVHLRKRAIVGYWLWLLKEILKANIDVCYRIVHPGMPISPRVVNLTATQKFDLGRVIYANSITLTPGTVSMSVDGDRIQVHALSESGVRSLESGEMDRRISRLEER